MLTLFQSQVVMLTEGINAFEPFICRLHADFKSGAIADWPVVILATTFQATAISIFRLLPPSESSSDVLDSRSLASLVRNVVETHDVLEMMAGQNSVEEFELNRNILGLYISSRINKIQNSIAPHHAEEFYSHSKNWYWKRIQKSPLYCQEMSRVKNGEGIFYKSRRARVAMVCGEDTEFILGILADLSTYVHSITPSLWLSEIENLYSNTEKNKNIAAVWLRMANFYFARSVKIVLSNANYQATKDLKEFIEYHNTVFS